MQNVPVECNNDSFSIFITTVLIYSGLLYYVLLKYLPFYPFKLNVTNPKVLLEIKSYLNTT